MTGEADLVAIRDAVAALCQRFPGEYWRELDCERTYRTAFVRTITEEGFLGALIRKTTAPAASACPQAFGVTEPAPAPRPWLSRPTQSATATSTW